MDKIYFYNTIRASLFGGKLTKAQVSGIGAILSGADYAALLNQRQLAYVLATAYHETAARMVPVRETLAPSDDIAIKRLDAAYAARRLPQVKLPYWRRDGDGKSWLGRGLVQLTFKRNYQTMSLVTGVDLVKNPNLALDPKISVQILIRGMQLGSFSGATLDQYNNGASYDWIGARHIINGTDRAETIAGYADCFYEALIGPKIEPRAA